MSQTITFYPLGNAESILLELSNGKNVLFDFADTHTDDIDDKRINLTNELGSKKKFDVVIFSHAHEDHVKGAKDFFEFDHAKKYQGGNRSKINELWVSSAFILDTDLDSEDARVIRQEARHRLKEGYGIKVLSEPDGIDKWLEDNGLSTDDDAHPIIHAGTIIDGSLHKLGEEIQFFVHAPFSEDADEVTNKNDPSIVLQVRLMNRNMYGVDQETNIMITGDVPHSVLEKIVNRSEANNNHQYLYWDIYDIPHHCSYTGLSDEKGTFWTTPTDEIKKLLSDYSKDGAIMIASCKPVADNAEDNQPPHIEAKRAYKHYSGNKKFLSTMEFPNKNNPKPVRYKIDHLGIHEDMVRNVNIITSPAPRAG